MSLFKLRDGDQAIISTSGVQKQVNLYERNGYLFAGLSNNSFILLKSDGSTSKPNTFLIHIETDVPLYRGLFNRLGTKVIPKAELLDDDLKARLMLEA